jgi:uncharacterized protein
MSALPLIGFGSVRHARLRPAQHRFTYGSYFLRLPLRATVGRRFGLRWLKQNSFGLFALHDADHGDGRAPLAWIESLLAQAGIHDARGEIWLHAFPRVLGYVFNPVSFWFCHREDGALRAVVCEVNNTFGEKHCYLLAHADGRPLHWGEELIATKAFHVSPFCQVSGRYRFRFMLAAPDPSAAAGEAAARFVARIDHDNADGPLLQTSIEGRLEPLTDAALIRAFFAYPAFTFGVMARIHWQALKLWRKRVPFFSKPEPPAVALTQSSDLSPRIDPPPSASHAASALLHP